MRKDTNNELPMLYWSDYFDEDDSKVEKTTYHTGHISHRGLLIALLLSSLLWGLILLASHALL